jgi:hypothetical protein
MNAGKGKKEDVAADAETEVNPKVEPVAESDKALDLDVNKDVLSGAVIKTTFEAEKPKAEGVWNTLEATKIAVSILAPLIIGSVGVWATLNIHHQDAERTTRENVRERRVVAEPLIDDLDTQVSNVEAAMNATKFSFDLTFYRFKQGPVQMSVDARKMRLPLDHAAEQFQSHTREDWVKLRAIVDNDSVFNDLQNLFKSGVEAKVKGVDDCFSKFDALTLDSRFNITNETSACAAPLKTLGYIACKHGILNALRYFDKPSTNAELSNLSFLCLNSNPAPLPTFGASAASQP